MFNVNGKALKDAIDVVIMKGKWCVGQGASLSSLGNAIVFEVGDECLLYNGTESTYVRMRVRPVEIETPVRFCVDSSILCKYLTNADYKILVLDEKLKLSNGETIVTIPLLERHPNNDNLLYCKKHYLTDVEDYTEGIRISPKTVLNTVITIETSPLIEGLKTCEMAGSSNYKFNYDDDVLIISSDMNNEEVVVELEVEGNESVAASMEFTAPLHKIIPNSVVCISFNDDSPLSIITRDMVLLRAPRIGE